MYCSINGIYTVFIFPDLLVKYYKYLKFQKMIENEMLDNLEIDKNEGF